MQSTVALKPSRGAHRRLVLGAAGFLLLTVGVFWFQFSRIDAGASRPLWMDLQWAYLALLIVCVPIETLSCALRAWVMTRILDPRVTFWICLKGEWANVAISTLTPTQSCGGPGFVYMMTRGGASMGTAITIMLAGLFGTLVVLMAIAGYMLLVAGVTGAWPLLLAVAGSFVAGGAAVACVAIWPALLRMPLGGLSRALWHLGWRRHGLEDWWAPGDPAAGPPTDRMSPLAVRAVDAVYALRSDLGRLLRRGKTACVAVCVLSVPFPISRALIAYGCLRFLGIDAPDVRPIFEAQLILTIVEFLAPSPGGAGVIELASSAVMGDVVTSGYAPYYNLLRRSFTLYLPALAGFGCLAAALLPRRGTCGNRRSEYVRTHTSAGHHVARIYSTACAHISAWPGWRRQGLAR